MTPDPKLVEALAVLLATTSGHGIALRWHVDAARAFFDRHNLVQLPEEPDGWEVEYKTIGWHPSPFWRREDAESEATDHSMATGRMRPVRIIPGDPQGVEP